MRVSRAEFLFLVESENRNHAHAFVTLEVRNDRFYDRSDWLKSVFCVRRHLQRFAENRKGRIRVARQSIASSRLLPLSSSMRKIASRILEATCMHRIKLQVRRKNSQKNVMFSKKLIYINRLTFIIYLILVNLSATAPKPNGAIILFSTNQITRPLSLSPNFTDGDPHLSPLPTPEQATKQKYGKSKEHASELKVRPISSDYHAVFFSAVQVRYSNTTPLRH